MDWVCLNSDGAVKVESRVVGCGGLVYDHLSQWLGGYSKFFGFCNPMVAEI